MAGPPALPPGFRVVTPPAQQPAPQGSATPRAPQVGSPILTVPVDPMKQSAEARAMEDQALQREAAARDEARLQIATDEAARKAVERQQGMDATEAERKAAAFLIRALGANEGYEGTGVGPRNLATQAIQDWMPNVSNTFVNSDARQTADSAQDEFIAASLRQDSGAAIPPEELERQRRIYFPMPGDGPQVIEQKRQARIRAIEGLRQSAGRLEAGAEERFQRLMQPAAPGASEGEGDDGPWTREKSIALWGDELFGPDGKPLGPDGGMSYDKDGNELGMVGSVSDDSPAARSEDDVRSDPDSVLSRADAFMRGVADVVSFGLADEIAAAGDTVFGGGTMEDNLEAQRATDRFDEQNNAGYRVAGQVGGGFLLPAARTRTALGGAGVGAAYGGAYGFGSGVGDIGDRLTSAGVGALVGGGVGGIAGRFTNRGGGTGPTGPSGREAFDAARRLDIDLMPADVGGPVTRMVTSGIGSTPGGTHPIVTGAERTVAGAEAARDRIARWFGTASPDELAGQTATEGALRFRSESRDRIARMYERVAQETDGVRIEPKQALQAIDSHIAELSAIPGASGQVAALEGLKNELGKIGPLTVQGIRGMRTQLRDRFMKEGLTGSDLERRVNEVVTAASEDLAEGLLEKGLTEQSALLRQADRQWRERMATLNEVILPIIGKRGEKSGEQVFSALQAATQGNNKRFTQFMESLPEAERNTVSASIIGALGRGSPAEGGAFSLGKFFTDWNKLGETARNALLTPQARAALNDLATVAGRRKLAEKSLNRSNTGLVGTTGATLLLDSMVTMGGTLAGQYAIGRILSSPAVTRALVKFSRAKTPEARARILQSFDDIAARQPAAANDIAEMRDALTRGLSGR